mmetsp:Transcript_36796/g.53924  ORF Transcript_36796/g.53924 Transcript_36796/m.53924 type:complete len:235 (-) Transcript_36796:224-928(-)
MVTSWVKSCSLSFSATAIMAEVAMVVISWVLITLSCCGEGCCSSSLVTSALFLSSSDASEYVLLSVISAMSSAFIDDLTSWLRCFLLVLILSTMSPSSFLCWISSTVLLAEFLSTSNSSLSIVVPVSVFIFPCCSLSSSPLLVCVFFNLCFLSCSLCFFLLSLSLSMVTRSWYCRARCSMSRSSLLTKLSIDVSEHPESIETFGFSRGLMLSSSVSSLTLNSPSRLPSSSSFIF